MNHHDELIAFIGARIDEDAQIAQRAASKHGPSWITGYPLYIGELVAADGPDRGLNVAESDPHHVVNPGRHRETHCTLGSSPGAGRGGSQAADHF